MDRGSGVDGIVMIELCILFVWSLACIYLHFQIACLQENRLVDRSYTDWARIAEPSCEPDHCCFHLVSLPSTSTSLLSLVP